MLPGEPQQLAASFEGRDAAMSRGLRLEGRRYEVRCAAAALRAHGKATKCSRPFGPCLPPRQSLPSTCHLQVHRYHPPLVYGRSMVDCEPEQSTGIAVCRVDRSRLGARPCYIAVTYEQPQTSARIVPRLVAFAQQHLEAP